MSVILDRHPLHTYGALESLGHSGTSTYFSHTLLHAALAHLEHLELQPVLHMFVILQLSRNWQRFLPSRFW